MTPDHEVLQRENFVVLLTVQALLGLISKDVNAVAVQVSDDRVTLRFWVNKHSAEIDEDINDVIFELEALFTQENPSLESEVYVGSPDPDWPKWAGRMVYWSKG